MMFSSRGDIVIVDLDRVLLSILGIPAGRLGLFIRYAFFPHFLRTPTHHKIGANNEQRRSSISLGGTLLSLFFAIVLTSLSKDLHNHVTTQSAQAFVTTFLNRCVRAHTEHGQDDISSVPILDVSRLYRGTSIPSKRALSSWTLKGRCGGAILVGRG